MANNVLLVGLAVVIGFGTVFPVSPLLAGDGVIVTGRYFALVAAPLAVALLALLGVGPRLRWRAGSTAAGCARRRPAWSPPPSPGSWFAERRPLAVLMVGLAGAAAALTVAEWRRRPRARWPIAHLGVAVLLAGVAGTTTGAHVAVPLGPGDEVEVRGWTLQLIDVVPVAAPDGGRAAQANLLLRRGGETVATLRPVALVSDAANGSRWRRCGRPRCPTCRWPCGPSAKAAPAWWSRSAWRRSCSWCGGVGSSSWPAWRWPPSRDPARLRCPHGGRKEWAMPQVTISDASAALLQELRPGDADRARRPAHRG